MRRPKPTKLAKDKMSKRSVPISHWLAVMLALWAFAFTPSHGAFSQARERFVFHQSRLGGLRKTVTAPADGRAFKYQNLQLATEDYTGGQWQGARVQWGRDEQGILKTLTVTSAGGSRIFRYGYDQYARLDTVSTAETSATYQRGASGRIEHTAEWDAEQRTHLDLHRHPLRRRHHQLERVHRVLGEHHGVVRGRRRAVACQRPVGIRVGRGRTRWRLHDRSRGARVARGDHDK